MRREAAPHDRERERMYFTELWTMYDTYLSSYSKKIHKTLTRTLHGGYSRFFLFPWQLFLRLGVVSSASPWKHGCQGPVISFQLWSMERNSITGFWTRDNMKTLRHYEMYEGMVKKLISCIDLYCIFWGSLTHWTSCNLFQSLLSRKLSAACQDDVHSPRDGFWW